MHHHHPFHQSPSDKNHEGNNDTARESLEGSDIKVKERKGMFWEWRRGKQRASKSVQEIQYLRPKQTLSSLNQLGESGKIKMEHNHFIVTAFLELCVLTESVIGVRWLKAVCTVPKLLLCLGVLHWVITCMFTAKSHIFQLHTVITEIRRLKVKWAELGYQIARSYGSCWLCVNKSAFCQQILWWTPGLSAPITVFLLL